MKDTPLAQWHKALEERNPARLQDILAEDAVMISPVVHTHQQGRAITALYLTAAMQVFGNDTFRYTRELEDSDGVVLEFETEVDGIFVNGVDMIKWNDEGKIKEFKVMVRPLQGMQIIHKKMGELLEQFQAKK